MRFLTIATIIVSTLDIVAAEAFQYKRFSYSNDYATHMLQGIIFFNIILGIILIVFFIKAVFKKNTKNTIKGVIMFLLWLTAFILFMIPSLTWQTKKDALYDFPYFPTDKELGPGWVGGCNGDFCVEEHGKIAVAKMSHTEKLVKKYGAENVYISALGYQFIKDEAYIKRLLGEKFGKVDCIIPIQWPGGERVYIEIKIEEKDEEKNSTREIVGHDDRGTMEYIPITKQEFDAIISQASKEDRKILFQNMNNEQRFVRKIMDLY